MAENTLNPVIQAKVDEAKEKAAADCKGKSSKELAKKQKSNNEKQQKLAKEKEKLEDKKAELDNKIANTTDDKAKLKLLKEKEEVDKKLEENATESAVAAAEGGVIATSLADAKASEAENDKKKKLDDYKDSLDGLSPVELQAQKAKINPNDPLKAEKEAIIDQQIKDVEAEDYRDEIKDLGLDKLEALQADSDYVNSLTPEKQKVLQEEIDKKKKEKQDAEDKAIKEQMARNQKRIENERKDNIEQNALYKGSALPNFNFILRVEFAYDIPCKSVKAFSKKNAYEHIQEGGVNDYVLLKRKPITEPFEFQIERYATNSLTDPLANGAELTAPVFLMVKYHQTGNDNVFSDFTQDNNGRFYMFTGCVVTGKEYGELNAERSGLLTEIVTISYREMYVLPSLMSLGGGTF